MTNELLSLASSHSDNPGMVKGRPGSIVFGWGLIDRRSFPDANTSVRFPGPSTCSGKRHLNGFTGSSDSPWFRRFTG